jgi:hypothetical protein
MRSSSFHAMREKSNGELIYGLDLAQGFAIIHDADPPNRFTPRCVA